MITRFPLIIGASLFTCCLVCAATLIARPPADAAQGRVVRLAELDIDPAVLTLNAVAVKDNAASIRIFEIYSSEAAYRAHLETPHFKKYKTLTQHMITHLNLVETTPIILGSK
jgi:4-carboxymuconolactone decarboxylase